MAAPATTRTRRRPAPRVEQPPRTIVRGGDRADISHLAGEALYEAIISDEEQWGYSRVAAECGRSVARVRRWVQNVAVAERGGRAADDKTFIAPDGYIEQSPWWYAGNARRCMIQIGVMSRAGRAVPYRPTGRAPGAKDLVPRKRWAHAPLRDTAAGVYREYLECTTRKRDPLTDRQARAELCRRHGLTRTQLARRIKAGRGQVEGGAGQQVEVDNAALRDRLAELVAAQRAAGYSERGADARARAALAEETGLTRRQIAGYIAAAAAETSGGDG